MNFPECSDGLITYTIPDSPTTSIPVLSSGMCFTGRVVEWMPSESIVSRRKREDLSCWIVGLHSESRESQTQKMFFESSAPSSSGG